MKNVFIGLLSVLWRVRMTYLIYSGRIARFWMSGLVKSLPKNKAEAYLIFVNDLR